MDVALVAAGAAVDGGTTKPAGVLIGMRRHDVTTHLGDPAHRLCEAAVHD